MSKKSITINQSTVSEIRKIMVPFVGDHPGLDTVDVARVFREELSDKLSKIKLGKDEEHYLDLILVALYRGIPVKEVKKFVCERADEFDAATEDSIEDDGSVTVTFADDPVHKEFKLEEMRNPQAWGDDSEDPAEEGDTEATTEEADPNIALDPTEIAADLIKAEPTVFGNPTLANADPVGFGTIVRTYFWANEKYKDCDPSEEVVAEVVKIIGAQPLVVVVETGKSAEAPDTAKDPNAKQILIEAFNDPAVKDIIEGSGSDDIKCRTVVDYVGKKLGVDMSHPTLNMMAHELISAWTAERKKADDKEEPPTGFDREAFIESVLKLDPKMGLGPMAKKIREMLDGSKVAEEFRGSLGTWLAMRVIRGVATRERIDDSLAFRESGLSVDDWNAGVRPASGQ